MGKKKTFENDILKRVFCEDNDWFIYLLIFINRILKLMEVGLLDALQDRYLEPRVKRDDNDTPQPIEIYQVSIVFIILCCGMVIAIIVFIIEKIVFVYKPKQL